MSQPFVGEIRIFAGNFAPRSWAYCDGQLLAVAQNDALFSLFGTIYGGDGRTTFGLPDLRGRVPIHQGTGPGLSNRRLGSKAGGENATVTTNQLAAHSHGLAANTNNASSKNPANQVLAQTDLPSYFNANEQFAALNGASIGNTGGSQQHNNLMPTLCVHFIVALFGVYPSRN